MKLTERQLEKLRAALLRIVQDDLMRAPTESECAAITFTPEFEQKMCDLFQLKK